MNKQALIEQVNGTEPKQPTPDERALAFKSELDDLLKKYNVSLVPFIKHYNNGQQLAEVEIVANAGL